MAIEKIILVKNLGYRDTPPSQNFLVVINNLADTVISDVPGLEADRLECGAADVLLARVLRQADDGPARVRPPSRRVQPRKTEIQAVSLACI